MRAVRVIRSAKYPGWAIWKEGPDQYFMTQDSGVYGVAVYRAGAGIYGVRTQEDVDSWTGELLVRKSRTRPGMGLKVWEPTRDGYLGPVADVVAEADRRSTRLVNNMWGA